MRLHATSSKDGRVRWSRLHPSRRIAIAKRRPQCSSGWGRNLRHDRLRREGSQTLRV